jgi:transposase
MRSEQRSSARQRGPKSEQSLALRFRIVLSCAEGLGNSQVSDRLGVDVATVRKLRRRFSIDRLDGLHDKHRPGVPRTFGDDAIEALIVKTLTEKPKGSTHWCTRDMAKVTGMSQPTVARVWKASGPQALGHGHLQALRGFTVHREGP